MLWDPGDEKSMPNGRSGARLKLDEKAGFNGEAPFTLIPPKLSSNTDDGDCSSQRFDADLAWTDGFDSEKTEGS